LHTVFNVVASNPQSPFSESPQIMHVYQESDEDPNQERQNWQGEEAKYEQSISHVVVERLGC
jgi:hypothetical protein